MNPLSHLYSTARWQKVRALQLSKQPLCVFCLQTSRTTAATVADHVVPHRGSELLFWFGSLQSLCATCHNSTKKRMENGKAMQGCDAQGNPLGGWLA